MSEQSHRVMKTVHMLVTNACAPDPRVERHANWFIQAGWKVVVHAFDRRMTEEERTVNGDLTIRRHRTGDVPFGRPFRSYLGIRKFLQAVKREITSLPCDLVYCNDADTLKAGIRMARRMNCPSLFDMHDLHHTWILMNAKQTVLRRLASRWMKSSMIANAKKADRVITSSGQLRENGHLGFVEWLRDHGIDAASIQNRPKAINPNSTSASPRTNNQWVVGYFGRVRELAAFELLVKAVRQMPNAERPSLHIAGDGVAWNDVKDLLTQNKEHVSFVMEGAFTATDRTRLFQHVDVMYAVYDPARGNILDGALPVKVFDAAVHGVPSVVNSGCLVADLVEHEGTGISVLWNNPEQLASALLQLKGKDVAPGSMEPREKERFLAVISGLFGELKQTEAEQPRP